MHAATHRRSPYPCLAVILFSSLAAIPAQDARERFLALSQAYEERSRNFGIENLRELDRVVRDFAGLSFGDDHRVREAAEKLLRSIVLRRGPDEAFRIRVAALETLATLAHSAESARFLLSVVQAEDRRFEGLEFWVGRAIGRAQDMGFVATLCKEGLGSRDPRVRRATFAGFFLLDHPGVQEVFGLHIGALRRGLDDADAVVRFHALRLAGKRRLMVFLPMIMAASKDKDSLVRLGAAYALGAFTSEEETWAVIGELLIDADAGVREEMVLALGLSGDVRAFPILVARLDKEPVRVQTSIYGVLEGFTGTSFDLEPGPWNAWWEAQGERLLAEQAKRGGPSGRVPATRTPAARGRYAATYYGIPVASDRLLFILDVSGSMDWGGDVDRIRRIDVAKRELLQVVNRLTPSTRFNVFAFSGSNVYFQPKGMLRPTPGVLRQLNTWIENLSPAGGTNTDGALDAVFERYPEVDTVYLLTDGSPTLGKQTVQERIVADVNTRNLRRRVRIHTIALLKGEAPTEAFAAQDNKSDAARFMALLAEITGGSFVRHDG